MIRINKLVIVGVAALLHVACGAPPDEGVGQPDVESNAQAVALEDIAGYDGEPASKVAGARTFPRRATAAGTDTATVRASLGAEKFAGEANRDTSDIPIAGETTVRSTSPVTGPAPAELVLPADPAAAKADIARNSAKRDPNRSWREYAEAGQKLSAGTSLRAAAAASVYDSRTSVWSANTSNLPVWTDAQIWSLFRAARDNRHMSDSGGFRRRPTWMYPDDGCWIRAELAAIAAVEAGLPKPHKLFSFGSLTVSTPNSPSGSVSWWYHVVPVVKRTDGAVFVLDPAIDPTRPLGWGTWLLRQVTNLNNVEVTFADSGAYGPFDPVTGSTPPSKPTVISNMQGYMSPEWSRQVALGRDPVVQLGYFPPWASAGKDFNADGKPDIVWRHPVNGTTQPWYMNGTTRTGWNNLPYTVAQSTGWSYAGSGDFNRDGKTDIIWYHASSGTTQIWYMDGITRTSWANLANTVPASSGWVFAGADDFNYDGKTDIMWHNGSTGYTQIWYLNDSLQLLAWPNLAPPYLVTDASGWKLVATGDFNRDGKTDVMWRHGASGTHQAWYLNEVALTGWANMPYTVSDGSGWRFFSAREFSYDGRTDIIWQHGASGTLQLWRMDGLTRLSYSNLPYTVSDASGWFGGGY